MKKLILAFSIAVGTFAPLSPVVAASSVQWICAPSDNNGCGAATVTKTVPISGKTITTRIPAQEKTVADCFFVYPTMSPALTWNAPNRATNFIRSTVKTLTTPFARTCRIVAPVYQQVTTHHLTYTQPTPQDRAAIEVAYLSLRTAWLDYLNTVPAKRPVLLIGFSQGAGMLSQLLRREIVPHPKQLRRVILSELVGGGLTITTPRSKQDGLGGVALCPHIGTIRCAIAFDAFTVMPPRNAVVGRPGAPWSYLSAWTPAQGATMACVNPVYGGRLSGPLIPYFGNNPYYTYANRFRAACESQGGIDWLDIRQIDVPYFGGQRNALPQLPADANGSLIGLHGESWSLTLGNLVMSARAAVSKWAVRP